MRLIARKKCPYAKKVYQPGEPFEATRIDAQVLIAAGLAQQDLTDIPPPVVPVQPEVTRRRGRYQTRDMKA